MSRLAHYRSIVGSLAILALGTALGLGGAWLLTRVLVHGAETRFQHQTDTVYSALMYRLKREQALLLAARGFYLGSDDISPTDWKNFATALYAHANRGRALLHLAYAPATAKAAVVSRMAALGVSPDKIHPQPVEPPRYYCVVDRIWPKELESKVLGLNPCGSKNQTLFSRSAASGGLIVTGDVPLYSQYGVEHGIVFIVSTGTLAAAGKNAGWVAETVPSRVLFSNLLPGTENVRISLQDISGGSPKTLYENRSEPLSPPSTLQRLFAGARINHDTVDMAISNRHWRLALAGRVETGWIPVAVAVSGFIISLLLAALFYALARTGRHAQALARYMTQELSASRELLTSVSNNVRDGIYRGTPESGIVYINRTLARMFGYNDEFSMELNVLSQKYLDPSRRDELREKLFIEHRYEDEEVEFIRDDGSIFTGLNSAWTTCDSDGRILYYDGVVTDISERKSAARRIQQMTYYDRLTGLPNQALLEERFAAMVDHLDNGHLQMAVLVLNLDNFKDINGLHGHEIGDELLRQVAQRVRAHLRAEDIAARLSGDEFVILLHEASSVAAVTQAANRISETLSLPYEIFDRDLHTTPSIGIAMYPQDGSDLPTLRQHADSALYQAKQSGRANIAYFAQELNKQARRQMQVENALRQAIERNEMSVYYQPRANVRDGTLSGVEALLRWHHPEWGDVEPSEFIPIAERTGQIVGIGNWVLEQALQEWKRWSEKFDLPPRVAVNVSARQLQDDSHFSDAVVALLRKHDVAGEALEIEITETMLVDHLQKRAATLSNIKALGVSVALDDFGTGYSSLSYLSRFIVDVIKVDKSFIRGLSVDTKDTAIVHTVSILSRAMGIELVAEGVETTVQMNALRRMRYQAVQGYIFAPPMTAAALLDFMLRLQKEGPPDEFMPV